MTPAAALKRLPTSQSSAETPTEARALVMVPHPGNDLLLVQHSAGRVLGKGPAKKSVMEAFKG